MSTFSFTFRSSLGEQRISTLPKNWEDLKFQLVRNKTYKGMGRKIAGSFEFVKDARKIVKDLYDKEGIDAYLEIDIWIHNDSKWRNRELFETYKGDFSEYKCNDTFASINMLDSSFEEKVNSRASTKLKLNTLTSIDGDVLTGVVNPVWAMNLHDRTLLLKNKHVIPALSFNTGVYRFIDMDYQFRSNQDVQNVLSKRIGATNGDGSVMPEQAFLLNSEKDISLKLNIYFKFQAKKVEDSSANVYFRIYDFESDDNMNVDNTLYSELIYTHGWGQSEETVEYTKELTLEIEKGRGIAMAFYRAVGQGFVIFDFIGIDNPSYILSENVDYNLDAPTTCNTLLPHDVGERLLQLMTGEQTPLYAPIFGRTDIGYQYDGMWAYLAQCNGYGVRRFVYDSHPIITTFKEWFESYSSILNLAAYIEKTDGYTRMVIDYLYNVFDSSKVGITITNYSDLNIKPLKDEYFGEIAFGYEDQEHENVTGLDSFNGEMNHATPITNTSDRLDKISKYVADDYAIAIAQRKPYKDYPTEDTRYDDMNMLIHGRMLNGKFMAKRDEDFETVTGILAPDKAYNLNLSPMRNLLRHSNSLATGLYRKTGKSLKFTKGARNSNLVTKRTDEINTVYENADIPVEDLGTPIFVPNLITFKSKLTWQDAKFINNNPNHLIEMTTEGTLIYGFIDEFTYNITTTEAEFSLIQSNR